MLDSILASLLLTATLFTAPVDILVLTSGERIPIRGDITAADGKAVFHHRNGSLYSLPLYEVDVDATQRLADTEPPRQPARLAPSPEQKIPQIRVSEEQKQRLLAELEKSRGTAGEINRPRTISPPAVDDRPPGVEGQVTRKNDEWYWRGEARRYEEALRQRQEELELLIAKEQRLNDEVLGLLTLGYKPQQFSYQVNQLDIVRDQLVYARLEVTRAARAYDQFRDDARRQGILPGWLR